MLSENVNLSRMYRVVKQIPIVELSNPVMYKWQNYDLFFFHVDVDL